MTDHRADVAIVGGGIVGLATAYRLQERQPGLRVVVLEKEAAVGQHQTGHNSGVLHTGIYYKPGSLKALNCRAGKAAMEQFCAAQGIAYEICGKVIVATRAEEVPQLDRIQERGLGQRGCVRADRAGAPTGTGAARSGRGGAPRARGGDRGLQGRRAAPRRDS